MKLNILVLQSFINSFSMMEVSYILHLIILDIKWFLEELLGFVFSFLADRMKFGFYVEDSKHAVNGVSAC